jgi:hypothetical protein
MTNNPTASKIVIPRRYWVYLLLLFFGLFIGFVLAIPTPANIGTNFGMYSPLPTPVIVGFFRLAAPLRGWEVQLPPYISEYGFTTKDPLYSGMCTSIPWMLVQIDPALLIGTYAHVETREGRIGE